MTFKKLWFTIFVLPLAELFKIIDIKGNNPNIILAFKNDIKFIIAEVRPDLLKGA